MRTALITPMIVCLVAAGCATTPDVTSIATESPSGPHASASACTTRPACEAPSTAGPPEEGDLPADWDEPLDGDVPLDAALDDDALLDLLRTPAQASPSPEHCGPDDVTGRLEGFDMWLGHRATWLKVRNTAARPCVVEGIPGVGARGEWGHNFALTVEPATTTTAHPGPITLEAGGEAQAMVEWTGELAGSGAERVSSLVFQLASGQAPIRVPAAIDDDRDYVPDLGMLSTVKITPFQPAD